MEKAQKEAEEDESSSSSASFEAPDSIVLPCRGSFDDSDITYDRSDRLEQDGSSGSEGSNNDDLYADYRRQTERIRTREHYHSPLRNRVTVQAPGNLPLLSRPVAAVHQKMNQTMNHFRKENKQQSSQGNTVAEDYQRSAMRSVSRNHSSESSSQKVTSKTRTGSMDSSDFQLLASGGISEHDRNARRSIRRSQSADKDAFEHALYPVQDGRRNVRRTSSRDGNPLGQKPEFVGEIRRGVRRHQSADGSVFQPRRNEVRERRIDADDDDEKLDFQALAAGDGRVRRNLRQHKSSDQF